MTDIIQETQDQQDDSVDTPKKRTRKSKDESTDIQEDSDCETPSSNILGIFKLDSTLEIPKFQTGESACFDISAYLPENTKAKCISNLTTTYDRRVSDRGLMMNPGERALIPTGLVFDIPKGYCLEIYPRSGVSFKRGLTLNNCTAIIDSDYVEEVFISIHNTDDHSQYIKHGERIAQAKLVKLVDTSITELSEKPTQKTDRNGGFGSTGA